MEHYLIIVSRDRPDLWETLAIVYGRWGQTEIHFDRRHGQPGTGTGHRPDRRTPTHRESKLHKQGFFVIRQPEMVAALPADAVVSAGAHERRASPLMVFFD